MRDETNRELHLDEFNFSTLKDLECEILRWFLNFLQ